LANDGDATNDGKTISFSYKEPVTLYGARIYDETFTDWADNDIVSFDSSDPATLTLVNAYGDSDHNIYAGEYLNGNVYAFEVVVDIDAQAIVSRNFVKLNKSWTAVYTEPATETPNDMAYDHSTGTMYAITYSQADGEVLKTVDLGTGELTTVAAITGVNHLYALAIDLTGNAYGVDDYGDFVSVNKTTGVTTVIGSTGVEPYYIQSMAFDHNSGRLFWAMCNYGEEGKLLEINPETATIIDYGTLGGNAEVVALHTPYSSSDALELDNINIKDGATGIDPELAIVLTFNKNITSTHLADITLSIAPDAPSVDLTPSISGSVLTIAHAKLDYATVYELLIPTGTIDGYDAEIGMSFTTGGAGLIDVKATLGIYPNPAKGVVYLSYLQANSVVSIKDLTGRTVKTYTKLSGENVKLDLPVAAGIYFIQVEGNNATTTHKLIVK
jgi:hypothetical protein